MYEIRIITAVVVSVFFVSPSEVKNAAVKREASPKNLPK